MDSDKAADVRDALNGLPCVAYDPEVNEHNYGDGVFRSREYYLDNFDRKTGYTGAKVDPSDYSFIPARINESGQISFGKDAPMRPCYEVVLEPLTFPTRPLPSISIPPSVVHEVAKYDCRLRVTSGLRGEFRPGVVRVRDDLQHAQDPDQNGDRCPDCRGTRFKLKSGVPECVRCGTRLEDKETTYEPKLADYV